MLAFVPSDAALLVLQAGCVAAPRVAPGVAKLDRFHGPAWAIVPAGSIIGVIFTIRYVSASASWLTYLALIAVPILAAASLAWAQHGARWWLGFLMVPLFWLFWKDHGPGHSEALTLATQGSGALLCALSCVTLGVLLNAVAPSGWLKLGVVAMSAADVWLIATTQLQAPNTVLSNASPGHGLPSLQVENFGQVQLGYGDLFVAGVFGALLCSRPVRQWAAAVLTLVLAGAFDLLFFAYNDLPATVPVAVALIVVEVWDWRARRRAQCAPSPVEAGGRDSSASEVIASTPRAASSSTSVASSAERA